MQNAHAALLRSRKWCFTLNNYSEEEYASILLIVSTYLIVGKEVGSKLTPHLQGFVYFKEAKTLSSVKRLIPRAHLEIARGSFSDNRKYCSKEESFVEVGVLPLDPADKGKMGVDAARAQWALARAGTFEDLPIGLYQIARKIYNESLVVADRPVLDNLWIHGPSGCGKSRYVRDKYPVFYTKPMSKWWDGYNGEDVVVLDDFDPTHEKFLAYFLKIWTDHYVINAEIKGSMIRIRPLTFIVTSQYSLVDCFQESETYQALFRRFVVTDMSVHVDVQTRV